MRILAYLMQAVGKRGKIATLGGAESGFSASHIR
jgi:hypothetical protein